MQIEKKNVGDVKWRIWVSIPVPPACKAGTLPFELIPQLHICFLLTHFIAFYYCFY